MCFTYPTTGKFNCYNGSRSNKYRKKNQTNMLMFLSETSLSDFTQAPIQPGLVFLWLYVEVRGELKVFRSVNIERVAWLSIFSESSVHAPLSRALALG